MKLVLTTLQDDERPVYVVGNFNNWHPADPRFRMTKTGNGKYEYTFHQPLPETMEYKYVKGDWRHTELDQYGNKIGNRKLILPQGTFYNEVPRWRKNGLFYDPAFLPKIEVISEAFDIPQLDKTRKVTILLPYDYHQSSKRYPVLYIQDGQNLFNDHAPFGNWEIDRKMAVLAERGMGDLIIVAIDHGEKSRITEYTPIETLNLGIGQGEGELYINFMKDTLKPHIDQHYRTLTDAWHTGVGGSSMGGLISLYAGLIQPNTFGRLMVFSPSIWIYPKVYEEILNKYDVNISKIYLYAGDNESETMVEQMQRLQKVLLQKEHSNNEVLLHIKAGGTHSESEWSMAFPKAVEWLFF